MKRFAWPLQRYLDVICRREDAAKAQFAEASLAVAQSRRAIRRRTEALASALREIARRPQDQRLADQQIAIDCEPAERRVIATMQARFEELQAVRRQRLVELRDLRARREMLEKLREEARSEHNRQANVEEQRRNDETSQIAFVRRAAQTPAACRSMTI